MGTNMAIEDCASAGSTARSGPRRSRWRQMGLQIVALTACLVSVSTAGFGQSASPGSTALEVVVVTAPRNVLEERIDSLPGGADLVPTQDIASTANLTISRALAATPGVIIQDFFGGNDQPRIQIRGSGLQQNPVERGVLVLQDGLPINRADGSYVVGFADPAQAEAIEIYRGYLANRLGATVLGGALNFISPTGQTAPGSRLAVSGGSFGQIGGLSQYGWQGDGYDALIQADVSQRDGYRDDNSSRRLRAGGNLGLRLSDNISARVFANYTKLSFDVSGPLTADLLKSAPRSVFAGPTVTPSGSVNPGPNVVRDQPQRDADQIQIGSRITGTFGAHLADLAFGYTWTEDSFGFPISSGIRETNGGDITGVLRYAYKPDGASVLPLFEATAQYVTGSAARDWYLNLSGEKGLRFGSNELGANTLSLNAGFHIPIGAVTLSPSIAYSDAGRNNADLYKQATRPTAAYNPANPTLLLPDGAVPTINTSYDRHYEGVSPALALSWRPDNTNLLFAAVSRSFEPPSHDDLLATVNGTPNSSAGRPNPATPLLPAAVFATPDLKAQRATTVEAGERGGAGVLSWDVTAYYSWVRDELLSLRDETGASLAAINADRTRHLGVELGLTVRYTPQLTGRIVYNYQDFRFAGDPVRSNNQLAGAPPHSLYAQADYSLTQAWSAGLGIRWIAEKTPIDNLNTVYSSPYAVVDLRSGYRINKALSIFGEVTNLFDKTYASSTLIVDQARPDQAAFLPGDGRAFYAGLALNF